jgi:hypothetical protein
MGLFSFRTVRPESARKLVAAALAVDEVLPHVIKHHPTGLKQTVLVGIGTIALKAALAELLAEEFGSEES